MESLRVDDNEGSSFILFGECVYAPTGRGQGIQCPALALSALFS